MLSNTVYVSRVGVSVMYIPVIQSIEHTYRITEADCGVFHRPRLGSKWALVLSVYFGHFKTKILQI